MTLEGQKGVVARFGIALILLAFSVSCIFSNPFAIHFVQNDEALVQS